MGSISIASANQVSQPFEVGAGTRVTTTGSGYVQYAAGTLQQALNNSLTWVTWPNGSSVGFCDTLRRVCIRAVSTGAMTMSWDENKRDEGSEGAYWQESLPSFYTDPATGAMSLVGPSGNLQYIKPAVGGVVDVVTIGDSMTAAIFANGAAITSATRSNNVVTVVATGHGFANQVPVTTINMVPADFNANNVTLTRVDANTFTYPSIGSNGSAASLGGNKTMRANNPNAQADTGYFYWLNGVSKGAFNLVHNAGANGQTSADMLARMTTDVLAYTTAKMVIIRAGYNDFAIESRTAAQVYADVVSMCALIGGAKYVVIVSAIPWTTGGTTANRAQAAIYNRMIRKFCNMQSNTRYADAAKYIVDATNATRFSPLSGMLNADGIHESAKGAERTAQAIWDAISPDMPVPSRLVSSNADTYGYDATNPNINDNAPFSNSGGALGGTASGTVALGFGVTNTGSGTSVASCPARSDGIGYDQQVIFTPAAANDLCQISFSGALSRVSAGQKLLILAELSLSGVSGSNLKNIEIKLTFNNSPVTSSFLSAVSSSNASALFPQADRVMTLVSPEIVVPTGATSISFYCILNASAAGTALTAKLGRMSIEIIS